MRTKLLISRTDNQITSMGWLLNGNPFMTPIKSPADLAFICNEMIHIAYELYNGGFEFDYELTKTELHNILDGVS